VERGYFSALYSSRIDFIRLRRLHARLYSKKAQELQNEPKATQRWDSCVYTAEEERDFVKRYLGKKMQDIGVKVFFWDHNKECVMGRASVMLEDEEAKQYITGIAFHWYSGDYFEELEMFHKAYPEKELVFTEGCYEYCLGESDTVKIGERYAHDIIGNFNNYPFIVHIQVR
jgi:glucosylceramidase